MEDFAALLYLGIPLFLMGLGFLFGKINEKRHYRSIHQRERATHHVPVVSWKTLYGSKPVVFAKLAVGSVVISVDHYKRFLMGLRKVFGGEVRAYSSLLDRARREALLRMKESISGADMFLNTRIETSTISNGQGKATGTVEVLVYGTAVKFGQ